MAYSNSYPSFPFPTFEILEKIPTQGVTHQHWRVASKNIPLSLIWRVPITTPAGFQNSRQYLEYQQECYLRLLPSKHTPLLQAMIEPTIDWPQGGLLIKEITGRLPNRFADWEKIATCLAAIHQLPINPLPLTIPNPANIGYMITHTIMNRLPSLDRISISPLIRQQLLKEIDWVKSFGTSMSLLSIQRCFNLYDCHPANFLIDSKGTAWFVDLEKITIGHPAIDLAHASLITSLSWHPSINYRLSMDDIIRFHQFYFSHFPPFYYESMQKLLWPVRRLIWIRTLSWAWDWLANLSFSPDPAIRLFQQTIQELLKGWFQAEFFEKMQEELQDLSLITGLANL